ncbi:MAG TPA: hypothetical protein VMR77_02445 [Patescibacteria group bacterium]|nr:hypothetical protein [Patescibacteria group bacterium]
MDIPKRVVFEHSSPFFLQIGVAQHQEALALDPKWILCTKLWLSFSFTSDFLIQPDWANTTVFRSYFLRGRSRRILTASSPSPRRTRIASRVRTISGASADSDIDIGGSPETDVEDAVAGDVGFGVDLAGLGVGFGAGFGVGFGVALGVEHVATLIQPLKSSVLYI